MTVWQIYLYLKCRRFATVTLGKYTTFKLLKFEIQYFHNRMLTTH